jgi:hypothetical protein
MTLHIQTSVKSNAWNRVSLQVMKLGNVYLLINYYISTVNLQEILKFVYLKSTYSLGVKYMKW